MIADVVPFLAAVSLSLWLLRLLYVAAKRGHVTALSRTVYDVIVDPKGDPASTSETRQTRTEQPFKYWANVIFALLMLPLTMWGVIEFGSSLWLAVFR